MSYHAHPNFAGLCNMDLITKLNKGLASRKFLDEPCNCNIQNRDDEGNCFFREECHKKLVIYKLICKECGYFYVESTKN